MQPFLFPEKFRPQYTEHIFTPPDMSLPVFQTDQPKRPLSAKIPEPSPPRHRKIWPLFSSCLNTTTLSIRHWEPSHGSQSFSVYIFIYLTFLLHLPLPSCPLLSRVSLQTSLPVQAQSLLHLRPRMERPSGFLLFLQVSL